MIEALKDDVIINKVGGRFKLAAMIQKRLNELIQGSRPLVKKTDGMTDLETVVQEVVEDKLNIDFENSDVPTPDKLK
ncbi:MAG: DNA-directed RNA polymerase subunit omega [Phycisphaerae bacterium]